MDVEVERTLIVFKPDAVQRGIVGEIMTRFERVGLKIIGLKMMAPNEDHYSEHYEGIGGVKSRHGEEVFNITLFNMLEAPVIAGVLEGINAIGLVRKMVGSTEPGESLPGTIRGDYAHSNFGYARPRHMTLPNIIHASANKEEAAKEIALWFNATELFDYQTIQEQAVRGKKPEEK